MTTNRSVPIVVVASENIPNKIRNIDDIEYELSQSFLPLSKYFYSKSMKKSNLKLFLESTPSRKSKGRSLIKCKFLQNLVFRLYIFCIELDKSAPPVPIITDENSDIKENEITRLHVISHILPRFPVRHGKLNKL